MVRETTVVTRTTRTLTDEEEIAYIRDLVDRSEHSPLEGTEDNGYLPRGTPLRVTQAHRSHTVGSVVLTSVAGFPDGDNEYAVFTISDEGALMAGYVNRNHCELVYKPYPPEVRRPTARRRSGNGRAVQLEERAQEKEVASG